MVRLQAAAFSLVAASQLCYFFGGLAFGGLGLGTVASLLIAVSAIVAAWACHVSNRAVFASALVGMAAVQALDYLQSVVIGGGLGDFAVGFTLIVGGALVLAVSASRWRAAPASEPWPRGMRWGAALSMLGAFTYIALNVGNLFSPNIFTVGTILSFAGWTTLTLS